MSIPASSVASGHVPRIGEEAPDFEVSHALPNPRTDAAHPRRLADLRGSPVVLAFQPARWDPSWAEHVRAYNDLITRVCGPGGTRLLSIAGGGLWHEFTFTDGALDLPVVARHDGAIARGYGVAGAPAVFVIDERGRVSWRHVGTDKPARLEELADALATLAPSPRREGASATSKHCTRREFVATAFAAAFVLTLAAPAAEAERVARAMSGSSSGAAPSRGPGMVTLHVNGHDVSLDLDPRVSLLDALRDYAGITGPKKGCDHGQCGACTVHVHGRRILSCLAFAVMYQGKEITTIEGLAQGDELHPMQRAFVEHDGFQCGYCTSGQIMSAAAVVQEPWGPTDDDVREAMSGNICRCGAYPGIVAAVQQVRGHGKAAGQ